MAFLDKASVDALGFLDVGDNVFISDKASIYGAERIRIGNNVRIDDFCIISAGVGGVEIGSYVHIAAYSSLIGAGQIKLSDFVNISSKVSVYSSSDDYSGGSLTSPMVLDAFKKVCNDNVFMGKHVIVGAGSVVLPGALINEGCAIGALSLVNKSCESFFVYAGIPVKKIKERKMDLLDLEVDFLSSVVRS